MSAPRLQDHVRIFHFGCGGIVVGPLDKPDRFTCAECGQSVRDFSDEESELIESARSSQNAEDATEEGGR